MQGREDREQHQGAEQTGAEWNQRPGETNTEDGYQELSADARGGEHDGHNNSAAGGSPQSRLVVRPLQGGPRREHSAE